LASNNTAPNVIRKVALKLFSRMRDDYQVTRRVNSAHFYVGDESNFRLELLFPNSQLQNSTLAAYGAWTVCT
jgi:hypothetical protein